MNLMLLPLIILSFQDEFSGPQIGEPLPDAKVKVIIGPDKGKEISIMKSAPAKPKLIIFVHQVTRPAVGMVRIVANYGAKRSQDDLVTTVVFLTADPTDTENWMNRAKRALPGGVNVALSMEGIEGPGAYGLNRKMQVTALVAEEKKIKANFALVQPSIEADSLPICHEVAKVLGDKKMPTKADLGIGGNGQYEQLMRPFIRKADTAKQTEMKAKEIERLASKNPALKKRIFDVANRIIDAGKLENYGNETAQSFLKKWSKEFGQKRNDD